ncbi:MAG: hypothetical protein ACXU9I_06115, partial [Syntrophales bacterium]
LCSAAIPCSGSAVFVGGVAHPEIRKIRVSIRNALMTTLIHRQLIIFFPQNLIIAGKLSKNQQTWPS